MQSTLRYGGGETHGGMVVRKSVVYRHVFKVLPDVRIKEALHFCVVEVRVDEEGPDVRLDYIWKGLHCQLAADSGSIDRAPFTFGGALTVVQ